MLTIFFWNYIAYDCEIGFWNVLICLHIDNFLIFGYKLFCFEFVIDLLTLSRWLWFWFKVSCGWFCCSCCCCCRFWLALCIMKWVMFVNTPATHFMLNPKVWYKREMLSPVLMQVRIIFHIKNIPNNPEINSPKMVNYPHIFLSLLSTILLIVFSSINAFRFILWSIIVKPMVCVAKFFCDASISWGSINYILLKIFHSVIIVNSCYH